MALKNDPWKLYWALGLLAVFLVLCATCDPLAYAQIQLEREYAPHRPIVASLDLPESPDGTQVIARWSVNAERVVLDEGRTVHIWAPPGTYSIRVEVITVNWTEQKISFDEHSSQFVVTGSVPETPDDPPVVVPTQKIFCTVLEESADRTIEQGRIYTSEALASYIKDGGHRWRVVDDDVVDENGQTPEDIETLKTHADSMPWLAIQSADGTVLWDGPLPGDESATIKLLKRYGGG